MREILESIHQNAKATHAALYLLVCEQARRVYYGALFKAKMEILAKIEPCVPDAIL